MSGAQQASKVKFDQRRAGLDSDDGDEREENQCCIALHSNSIIRLQTPGDILFIVLINNNTVMFLKRVYLVLKFILVKLHLIEFAN